MNRVHPKNYRVVKEILQSLDCPRSLMVMILFNHNEFDQIVNITFNPNDYNSLSDARNALQATELLRKCDNLPTLIDRKAVALTKFFECEESCGHINDNLADSVSPGLISKIRGKIDRCLGDFNPEEFVDLSGWGPGVTLTLKSTECHLFNKFDHDGECTPLCYRFIQPWFHHAYPVWQVKPRLYEGNKVITVPKNAKTDRVIAIEPSLNLYFQKGVGAMIRSRLKRSGIDLNDQTRNQSLARVGSKYDSLATIDFSSASDTISYRVVEALLPFKWFEILYILRSPRGVVGDEFVVYNKFSSMGNGYTFELESLIFWAIAKAVVHPEHALYKQISIFGDDLIIPSDVVDLLIPIYAAFGFTVNRHKSYSNGYYRESCGEHYWDGVCITPFYIRSLDLQNHYQVIKLHNALVRYAHRCGGYLVRDVRFKSVCNLLKDWAGLKTPRIPNGYGDGGLVCDFDEVAPTFARRYQRGFYTNHFSFSPNYCESESISVLLTRLKYPSVDRESNNKTALPRSGKYKRKLLYVPLWPNLGPWQDAGC